MAEKDQRSTVTTLLKKWDAIAVENPVYPGTPDVNCILGWIELKWLRSWPVREDTPVKLDHFTRQQRVWLAKRWHRGGSAWLLLQCGTEWLLFDGATAAKVVGHVDKKSLIEAARMYWTNKPSGQELAEQLTQR